MPKRTRLFDAAVQGVGQGSAGPGSASHAEPKRLWGHLGYGGSRRKNMRFEYAPNSTAGFAELHPDYVPTSEQFFQMLQQVPGVSEVKWQTSKTSQGNQGGHYMERNILVYSHLAHNAAIEFELTRNNHMNNAELPFTVTTCFKNPPWDLVPEAWRILRSVTGGKELFPVKVKEWHDRILATWNVGLVPGSASEPSAASGATQQIEDIVVSSSDEDAARAPEVSGQAALGVDSQPTHRGDVAQEPGPASSPPAPPSMQPTEESITPFAGDGAARAPAIPCPIPLDVDSQPADHGDAADGPGSASPPLAPPSQDSTMDVDIPPADHDNTADGKSAAGSQLGTAGDGSGFVAVDVAAGDLLDDSPLADYGDTPDEAHAPGSASAVQVSDPARVPLEHFENSTMDVDIPPADHDNAADRLSAAGSQLGTAGDGSGLVAADVAAGDLLDDSPLADYGDPPDEAHAPGSASAVQVSDPVQVPLEQFESTAALRDSLRQPMDETTAAAVEEAADLAQARRDMLPDFLRTGKEDPKHENKTFKMMREMKEREVEHVRYRSSMDHAADPSIQAAAQWMRMVARAALKLTQNELKSLCDESRSDSVTPADFVQRAHRRALEVTILKGADQKALRDQYAKLLEQFPGSTAKKVGGDQLLTKEGRAQAVGQLVTKHSGELVELDRNRVGWVLRLVVPGSASTTYSEQWQCREDGKEADTHEFEFGAPPERGLPTDAKVLMSCELKEVIRMEPELSRGQLAPDWGRQRYRVLVPCVGTDKYQWHRTGQVVALGELFMALGQKCTASAIYSFYRACRVVVLKRVKSKSYTKPGPASLGGTTGSSLQPAQIRHTLLTNKEQLVEEYAEANGLGDLDATRQNVDAAIRYMHKILLADMRPPWANHTFPQAVPGDGVLSRYIRPSFMQWDSGLGGKVLGAKVWELVGDVATAVDVTVAGYLARPLYVCTNAKPSSEHGMCMSIASMSRHIQQAPGQVHYRCSACVAKGEGVPVSDSAPLRVLHLYALIATRDDDATPMRMKPVRLVVHAPPDTWKWGAPAPASGTVSGSPQDVEVAHPTQSGALFRYNKKESDALWSSSSCYRGEDRDSSSF